MKFDLLSLHPDAFGLDISDLSLKILKLKKTHKSSFPVSYGNFPIPEKIVQQGEIKDEARLVEIIKNSLQRVQGEKLGTNHVIASLPEEKAFLRVIQLPQMNPQEVQGAVQFELENYIPYSPDTVYVDTAIIPPLKNQLDHIDVLLAALPRGTVDSYVTLLEKTGLVPEAFEIESLACARAVIQNGIVPWPTLLIDFGAARTSFIVCAGYSVRFTASIVASSTQLTQAIEKALHIDAKKAEELKRAYGIAHRDSAEGKEVFEALIPPLVDLCEQIKKYVDYYEAHSSHQHLALEDMKIKKMFLTGGGANMQGLREFLEGETKIDTALGNPWMNVFPQPFTKLPPFSLEEALKYTTAIGLALRGTFRHD